MTGRALSYVNGEWKRGNPALLGPMSHGFWLGSVAFDGARSIAGMAPDLDRHCARCLRSAEALGLKPMITAGELEELCWFGIHRFRPRAELYIRPVFYGDTGFLIPEPAGTRFVLTLMEMPLPKTAGFTACLTGRRRPAPDMAIVGAKASCHYPNTYMALAEAKARGFDNVVMLDPLGNVAEFGTSNLFIAKDGVVHTPVANGTFLAGITRGRVIALLREAGIEVCERTVLWEEVLTADEVFSTGNLSKVWPAVRIEDRTLEPGPMARLALDRYWAFARGSV